MVHFGAKVFEVKFWMALHGALSPKRSMFMGNLTSMQSLDKGTLRQAERERLTKIKTTRAMTFVISIC